MRLAELIELQRRAHGPKRLLGNLGDGFLYGSDPVFRAVRDAALARGFRFTTEDAGHYFGFPLASLSALLESRRIPYRDNFAALSALERARPGFFTLADLNANRPTPNHVLHEAAHAVAFAELFGRPRDVRAAISDPSKLVHVMLGESFAMAVEYFSACRVEGRAHAWLLSINSYRHRTPCKRAVGELIDELGGERVAWAVLGAFLLENFLVPRIELKTVARWLALAPHADARIRPRALAKLRRALAGLTVMSLEFRRDTARLFLTSHGYSRNVERVLAVDPLAFVEQDDRLRAACGRLVRLIVPRARDARP